MCSNEANSWKGYCVRHYQQMRIHGKIFERTSKDKNKYINCGNYFSVELYNKKNDVVGHAKIDKEDEARLDDCKIYVNNSGYCFFTKKIDGKRKHISLHRYLMNAPDNMEVDHINFDKTDNRKKNLRLVTSSENSFHQKNQKGIHVDKRCKVKKYFAIIYVNYKQIYLGHFASYNQALKKRKEAEKIYFPNIS